MANDMQAHILRLSTALFAKKGFDGVSVREISAAVGSTLATIYHHFPDKQALYDAAVHHAFAYMTERMVAATKSGESGERRLRGFLRGLVRAPDVRCAGGRLVDRELLEARPETLAKLAGDLIQGPHDALTQILREIAPHIAVHDMAEHIIAAAFGAVKLRAVRVHLRISPFAGVAGIADSIAAMSLAALRTLEAEARPAS